VVVAATGDGVVGSIGGGAERGVLVTASRIVVGAGAGGVVAGGADVGVDAGTGAGGGAERGVLVIASLSLLRRPGRC
jgi:hypothetical protein